MSEFECDKFLDKLKREYGDDKEYIFDGKWLTVIKRTEKELHIWTYEVKLEFAGEMITAP